MVEICAFVATGYHGQIVKVEVDMRRGLPGAEIIGLPDSAVKEAKERVRVAIKNSGHEFPRERLLINLTPASIKKEGSTFDLAIAIAILYHSEQIAISNWSGSLLILGELELSGRVRGVRGALSAVAQSINHDIRYAILPIENIHEAQEVQSIEIWPVSSLQEAMEALIAISHQEKPPKNVNQSSPNLPNYPFDMADLKGQPTVKRLLEIAASGRHHFLLFGPPGCGKTLSCKILESISPPLSFEESLEVSQIYSLKNELHQGLIHYPPFRMPHHSASSEGIIGGGKQILPGEISLAHQGVLFLDETPEFGKHLLQTLREPLENRRISIARAGLNSWYPADFQLAMSANVCPCGALGRSDRTCLCSPAQIAKYWKRMGAAILDRIDMRLAVQPVAPEELLAERSESSQEVRARVIATRQRQKERYQHESITTNAQLQGELLEKYCHLEEADQAIFFKIMQKLSLSARAGHSILRVARTIADMTSSPNIAKEHLLEAASYRRYGDQDLYWIDI
ncbi:YifB family Mg chelatase-like AAA ATPase [Entomospira culicis]|uniref:YifB family Mg chelatase-like AAA ATPase n=1 Tax=Entomospira culicis TaxID=2719989 RepID=A0A968KUG8_9SPIO|nr:YifB family Mg chelatase-like AAA ATPase [Entomospira culicis]NIZ18895.1 YifB family Mg chelatase-like AAA ATPase [Entomospira culicis]NIZ69110.1 YifB family Mg chelatase-like AAA ATPase [Entomospira culicis]WDI37696.1 YifB family Mg chelatase-like AAA ATPase [Entomospira culicis]WDI39324.1 YifB family Mg chelatase-like AAA ATPase [Entomospira culicis]